MDRGSGLAGRPAVDITVQVLQKPLLSDLVTSSREGFTLNQQEQLDCGPLFLFPQQILSKAVAWECWDSDSEEPRKLTKNDGQEARDTVKG